MACGQQGAAEDSRARTRRGGQRGQVVGQLLGEGCGWNAPVTGSALLRVSRMYPLEWSGVDSKDVGTGFRRPVERAWCLLQCDRMLVASDTQLEPVKAKRGLYRLPEPGSQGRLQLGTQKPSGPSPSSLDSLSCVCRLYSLLFFNSPAVWSF